MGVQDIIALVLAATAVGYVIGRIRRLMSNRGECGCGQGGKCAGGAVQKKVSGRNGTAVVFMGVMAILLRSVQRVLARAVWSVGRAVSGDV